MACCVVISLPSAALASAGSSQDLCVTLSYLVKASDSGDKSEERELTVNNVTDS